MRVEGTGGAAVSRVNDPEFAMFATKSGRDIHDDLARAHAPVVSPIKLQPLTKAEEAALYSGTRAPGTAPSRAAAKARTPRKPAPPARLPAPGPGPVTVEAVGPSAPPPADQAGRGQTTLRYRSRPQHFDHAAVLAAYLAGARKAAVARQFGCSQQTVLNIIRAAGNPPQNLPAVKAPDHVPQPVVTGPEPDLAAAGAAIVDHLHDRVSLPTTVRRLIQAGFTAAEVAVYCGVEEQLVVDAMVVLVRQAAI